MGKTRPSQIRATSTTQEKRPCVLDTGALIAFERGDPKMRALVREAVHEKQRLIVPTGVLAQAWRGTGHPRLRALLAGPTTSIVPLDRVLAEASGTLCGRAGTSDVIDAAVALIARREHAVVVTSDVTDLRRLDPRLLIERV